MLCGSVKPHRTAPHRKKKPHREKPIILDRKGSLVGSLMWPWEVSGQFLALLGCSALWQIMICRPLAIPQVLILIFSNSSALMLSCIFFKFVNSQPQIPIDQILNIGGVPYCAPGPFIVPATYYMAANMYSNVGNVPTPVRTVRIASTPPSHHGHRAVSPS